jgi:serine/threonine protein kinase
MGMVYEALDTELERRVAVKLIRPDWVSSPEAVARFKREARLMMDFKNDHIVHVYDHFKEGSSYFIVEEFVDGREINVGLLETNGKVGVLPASEIDYSEFPEEVPRICGYEAKWVTESPEYQKSKPICPAPLEWVMKKG